MTVMTAEERRFEFVTAYNVLVRKYGVVLESTVQTEKLGEAILVKPVISAVIIPEWTPETEEKPVSE